MHEAAKRAVEKIGGASADGGRPVEEGPRVEEVATSTEGEAP
jgi:hypothetical protein